MTELTRALGEYAVKQQSRKRTLDAFVDEEKKRLMYQLNRELTLEEEQEIEAHCWAIMYGDD